MTKYQIEVAPPRWTRVLTDNGGAYRSTIHAAACRTLGIRQRITDSKRMRAKLRALKGEIERRRHQPIPEQARWLASVLRGHNQYYAVPENIEALRAFRRHAVRHWCRALRRRSQRTTVTWQRMTLLEARWLPPPRILHPWPERRFDARTQGRSPVR